MQMDSSHATGSVCTSHKWLYAREVMMLRGNRCAASLSTRVAGAFPFALSVMSTYTHARAHTDTHTHTCAHARACTHMLLRALMDTRTRAHLDTCAHRCMLTRAHTHAHLHTRPRPHTRTLLAGVLFLL